MDIISILLKELTNLIWQHPTSEFLWWSLIILMHVCCTLILRFLSDLLSDSSPGMFRAFIGTVVGFACASCAIAITKIYLPDTVARYSPWIFSAVVFLGSLAVTIPFIAFIDKMGYVAASMSWLVSFGVTVLLLVTVRYCYNLYTTSSQDADQIQERSDEIEKIVGQ